MKNIRIAAAIFNSIVNQARELSGVAEHVIVLDAGTGIRLLGNELVKRANGELRIDLLISPLERGRPPQRGSPP